jgi:hypothetical protein
VVPKTSVAYEVMLCITDFTAPGNFMGQACLTFATRSTFYKGIYSIDFINNNTPKLIGGSVLPQWMNLGTQVSVVDRPDFLHRLITERRQISCVQVVLRLGWPLSSWNSTGDSIEHQDPA